MWPRSLAWSPSSMHTRCRRLPVLSRQLRGLVLTGTISLFALMLVTVYLMPLAYGASQSLRGATVEADQPLWPSEPAKFTYTARVTTCTTSRSMTVCASWRLSGRAARTARSSIRTRRRSASNGKAAGALWTEFGRSAHSGGTTPRRGRSRISAACSSTRLRSRL